MKMKKFKKTLSVMLVALLVMQLGMGCVGAFAASDYTIVSPYADVEWEGDEAWGAYKGTLHTHTTYSDATETLSTMIKEYYNQDYDFVANADHGITGVEWNKAPEKRFLYNYQLLIGYSFEHLTDEEYEQITAGSYPLYDGTIRNKEMVCVTGANEHNHLSLTKNHVNGYFLPEDVGNGPVGGENEYGYEQAVKFVDECGGLSHINHPGDWLASNSDMNNVNNKEHISATLFSNTTPASVWKFSMRTTAQPVTTESSGITFLWKLFPTVRLLSVSATPMLTTKKMLTHHSASL